MNWISVKERLPEESNGCIALTENGKMLILYVLKKRHVYTYALTHWMPFPKLPEE